MRRPDLNIAANMAVLEPHLRLLAGAVRRGFATYQDRTHYSDLARASHDNTAAAKNVHRHILDELAIAIADVPALTIINARGLMVLNIEDRAVLRFKKMDGEGRSSSYPTEQAQSFDRQLHLPHLPPAATRLTFGYEPDLAFSMIARILAACPHGEAAHWCVQVHDEPLEAGWVDITPRRLPGTEPFSRYG